MDSQKKSKEQIKADRKAKKAEKALAKGKVKEKDESSVQMNKVENLESEEKSKVNIAGSGCNTESNTSNTSHQSAEPPVTANVIIQGDKKTIDEHKIKEPKIPEKEHKSETKNKAELREERRAKQEAQRAAKQALSSDKKKPVKIVSKKMQERPAARVKKEELVKKATSKPDVKDNPHEVNLFKHLYINRRNLSHLTNRSDVQIHPAIVRLGVQYDEKVIVGSNARCVSLLAAIKQVLEDFERPSQADFTRGFESTLKESVNYLNFCRPSAVSMQNALKHLKWQMSTLPSTMPDKEVGFHFE